MDIIAHWDSIRDVVEKSLKSKRFCSMATVNPDGSPHVAPIGSLILQGPGKAYYFEKFPKRMRENLDQNPRLCVMAVQGGFWPMMKSLFVGRFDSAPGVRLMGRAGARRTPTEDEKRLWLEQIKAFRRLKGYGLLWGEMSHVRDITFDSFEPVRMGVMTRGLWGEA